MRRPLIYSICLLTTLLIGQRLMAQETKAVAELNDSLLSSFAACGCILFLAGLALWLFYNSNKLDKAVQSKDEDGKEWFKQHLNDFNEEQLDILIKHQQPKK